MLPAHERFGADDRLVAQRHDRLEVHVELVALERLVEVGGQLELAHGGVVHVLGVELVARRAAGLGRVHGQIGIAQDRGRVLLGRGEVVERDSDRGAGHDLAPADREWALERGGDPVHDVQHVLLTAELGQQHGEAVDADPGERVLGAHAALDPARERAQQLVTARISEALAHEPQAVEVEREHGQTPAVTDAPR